MMKGFYATNAWVLINSNFTALIKAKYLTCTKSAETGKKKWVIYIILNTYRTMLQCGKWGQMGIGLSYASPAGYLLYNFSAKQYLPLFSLLFIILIIISKASAHKHANTHNRRKCDASRITF